MTPKNWKDACGGGVLKEEKDWFGYKTKGLSYAKARRLDGILLGREIRPTESGIEQVVWDEKDAQLSASILPSIDTSFLYAYLPEWTAAQLWGHLVATFERTDMETQRSLEGELMRIEYEGDAAELQRRFESVQANLARFAPSETTARNAYLAARTQCSGARRVFARHCRPVPWSLRLSQGSGTAANRYYEPSEERRASDEGARGNAGFAKRLCGSRRSENWHRTVRL